MTPSTASRLRAPAIHPLTRPSRLRAGDRVVVVAPSGRVDKDLLEAGCAHLREWGLSVELAPHVLDRRDDLAYLAGDDAERAADLQAAWLDPGVAAVLCARGGYGSQRIIDLLDWEAMAGARPKVFAGSSDITALHEAFATRLELATLFSPMCALESFMRDAAAREVLRRVLFEPRPGLELFSPSATALVGGTARGVTVGGTVSLIAAGVGTSLVRPGAAGGIAVLEDVDEEPYRLDRLLTQLLRAGWFDGVAGVVLGSWTGCGPLAEVRAVVSDRLGGLGVPMLWELGFGHCADQLTVPLGVRAELSADAGTLTFLDPPLA